MKKYVVFILAAFLLLSVSVSAQEQGKKANLGIEKRVEKMASEIGLNDAEKGKVKTLLEKHENDYKELKNKLSPTSVDFKEKLKNLHNAQEEELKKTIGNEKYAKMKEIQAKEKEKMEASKANM